MAGHVNSTLPKGWERDETFRANLLSRMRGLFKQGWSSRAIAKELGMSSKTVERHRSGIR